METGSERSSGSTGGKSSEEVRKYLEFQELGWWVCMQEYLSSAPDFSHKLAEVSVVGFHRAIIVLIDNQLRVRHWGRKILRKTTSGEYALGSFRCECFPQVPTGRPVGVEYKAAVVVCKNRSLFEPAKVLIEMGSRDIPRCRVGYIVWKLHQRPPATHPPSPSNVFLTMHHQRAVEFCDEAEPLPPDVRRGALKSRASVR